MDVTLLPGGLGNLVGSAVIVAFGILVLVPRPRKLAQRSFAVFAVALGVGTGASNLVFADPAWPTALMWGLLGAGHAVAILALVGFVRATIGTPRGGGAILLVACFVALSATLTSPFFRSEGLMAEFQALGFPDVPTILPATLVACLFFAASWTAAIALARWTSGMPPGEEGQGVLLSSALVVYPAVIGTMGVRGGPPFWNELAVGTMVAATLVAFAWLWTARRAVRPRAAVIAAFVPVVAVTFGMLLNASTAPWAPGASRITMTALVAFAILRHHALGIDATLRFGISKGTVAGIVVAAVFVASEGAQAVLGEGRQWLGLVAGALVVFLIAPLQRAADRLAEAAVPHAKPAPALAASSGAEARYREVARRFLQDGTLSPHEEATLAHLAQDLGIPAGRAFELREEARRAAELRA